MWRRQVVRICRLGVRQCTDAASTEPKPALKPVLTGERSVNKITLVGRVGREPEVRGSEERPVTILSLATSHPFKNEYGEYSQKTDWHRIAIFRPGLRDHVTRTVGKGDRLYISGAISYNELQTEKGAVWVTSIIADDVITVAKKIIREHPTGGER